MWEGNYIIVGENYNSVHATPPLTSSAVEYSKFKCCGTDQDHNFLGPWVWIRKRLKLGFRQIQI